MASISKRTIHWTTQDGEPRAARSTRRNYRDRAGKRHRRSFTLKKDAQRWLDEQTAGIVTGQWADPRAGRETVNAYGERWLARQMIAPSTAGGLRTVLNNHIYPVIGPMRMDAITRADVQALVKAWASGSAPRTVEGRYSILAILLRAAVKDRVIPTSPCIDIKLPKIEPKSALVPISTETVLALREAISPRYRAFVTLGGGDRDAEGRLLGLTLDRVAFDFARIRVDRQLSRTSRSGRGVVRATEDGVVDPHDPGRRRSSCTRSASTTRRTATTSPVCSSRPRAVPRSHRARSTPHGRRAAQMIGVRPPHTTCVTTSPRSRSAPGSPSRCSRRCSATSPQWRPGTPTDISWATRTTAAGR